MKYRAGGYAYLYLLFAIALLAIAMTGVASLDMLTRRQSDERELLRIGHEFRSALISYRQSHPSRQFPLKIEDLLEDRRGGSLKRHLRKLYVDPVTRRSDWGVIRQAGYIIGVHSLSENAPMKVANFEPEDIDFEGKESYSEWLFLAVEPIDSGMYKPSNGLVPIDSERTPTVSAPSGKP